MPNAISVLLAVLVFSGAALGGTLLFGMEGVGLEMILAFAVAAFLYWLQRSCW